MQSSRTSSIYDTRYQSVIKLLIQTRKDKGLSQLELAKKLGFSQPDISKIERMERRLDIIELIDFVEVISDGDIFFYELLWKKINECHRKRTTS